jgi:hypothetical protein
VAWFGLIHWFRRSHLHASEQVLTPALNRAHAFPHIYIGLWPRLTTLTYSPDNYILTTKSRPLSSQKSTFIVLLSCDPKHIYCHVIYQSTSVFKQLFTTIFTSVTFEQVKPSKLATSLFIFSHLLQCSSHILGTCGVRKWGKTMEKGGAGYDASTYFMA